LIGMEALSISHKPMKTPDFVDRSPFRQTPPRRSPSANSAAQPIDPPPKPPQCTVVSHFCAIKSGLMQRLNQRSWKDVTVAAPFVRQRGGVGRVSAAPL
jgi:hypothetical protein